MLSNKEKVASKTDCKYERLTAEYIIQNTEFWKKQCMLSCKEQQIAKAVQQQLAAEQER